MGAEPNIPPPRLVNLVLPAGAALILAFTGYIALGPKLDSKRPESSDVGYPVPPSPAGMVAEYARLWEDPLEAAHRSKQSPDAVKVSQSHPWLNNLSTAEDGLHVIGVFLPGAPFSETSETRRRIRYAVTSALSVRGYQLEFPDRLSFVAVEFNPYVAAVNRYAGPICVQLPIKLYKQKKLTTRTDRVPTALKNVIVLWINESLLGDAPVAAFSDISERLFRYSEIKTDGEKDRVQFTIVGPSSSDGLLKIAKELRRTAQFEQPPTSPSLPPEPINVPRDETNSAEQIQAWQEVFRKTAIINYRATVGADDIALDESLTRFIRGTDVGDAYSAYSKKKTQEKASLPTMLRTIGTDRQLLESLFVELRLRKALPVGNSRKKHVVILTERDSLYGQGLFELFRQTPGSDDLETFGIHDSCLHIFTYLRGIDGRTQRENSAESSTSFGESSSRDASNLGSYEHELPAGVSQYDYIRRVAQQVVKLQASLRRGHAGEVSAIGVAGTDVYDKLLILRALRARLPNAVYFTTDLDSVLTHASEYEWTRNVLIASHFARQLHPMLQRDAPVFRDSYQTSCFFAMLLATKDNRLAKLFLDNTDKDPWRLSERFSRASKAGFLHPLVFEVSRSGSLQLTQTGGPSTAEEWLTERRKTTSRSIDLGGMVHPPEDRYFHRDPLQGVILATLSGLAFLVLLYQNSSLLKTLSKEGFRSTKPTNNGSNTETYRVIIWVGLIALALLLLSTVVDQYRGGGEPLRILDGISVWPTIWIRLFATCLATRWIFKSVADVRKRQSEVAREFNLVLDAKETRSWNWLILRLKTWKWSDLLPESLGPAQNEEPWETSVEDSLRRLRSRTDKRSIAAMVTPQVLLSVLFWLCLSPLGEPRNRPVRGYIADWLEWISFWSSLLALLVLTFFVLDITQCGRYFAKSLRKAIPKLRWRAVGAATSLENEDNSTMSVSESRAAIQLLAVLSKSYGKLILYPSTILFILILAHLTVFDNWTLPWPLLVLVILCIVAAIFGNFSYRNELRSLRTRILRDLREGRLKELRAGRVSNKRIQQFDQVTSEIIAETGGAFRPLAEDPLVQAISLPFGGVGGVVILEWLFKSFG